MKKDHFIGLLFVLILTGIAAFSLAAAACAWVGFFKQVNKPSTCVCGKAQP